MAVALDSSEQSASSVSEDDFSWVHTPVGTLAVLVIGVGNTPYAAGIIDVLVNGVSVGSSFGSVSSDEGDGEMTLFRLIDPPPGVLTIEVQRVNDATIFWGWSAGLTADTHVTVDTTLAYSAIATLSEELVNGNLISNSLRFTALFSGLSSVPSPGANSTALESIDNGANVFAVVVETTPGTGDRLVGFDSGTPASQAEVFFIVEETFAPVYAAGLSIYIVDPAAPDSFIDISPDWRADKGLTTKRGLDSAQPNLPPMAGTASFSLDNTAGTYLPGVSPIQRGTLIQFYYGFDNNLWSLWCGVVDKVEQNPMIGDESVDVTCLGMLSALTGKPPLGSGPLSTEVVILENTDEIITRILEQINFPGGTDFDSGEVIVAYWWAEGKDAWTAVLEMVNSEGPNAAIYELADGWELAFLNRLASTENTRLTEVQIEFSDVLGDQIQMARPFSYDDGLERLINYVRWALTERIFDAEVSTIWSYVEELVLGADEIVTFGISDTSGNPFSGTVTLLEGVDYVVTAGSLASIALDRASGETATLTITAGGGGATLAYVQVRARLLSPTRETVYVNTVGSPLDTGVIKQDFNGPTWQGVFSEFIIENINTMVVLWSSGRPMVRVTLQDINEDVLYQQLTRQIYDLVNVIEEKAGINDNFWITSIQHEVTPGLRLKTTYELVKAIAAAPPPPDPEALRFFSEDAAWGYADGSAFFDDPLAAGGWYNAVIPNTSDASRTIGGWYFPNITIDPAAVITSAQITVFWEGIAGYYYGWLNADVAFEDSDDAVSFVTDPSIDARPLDANSDVIDDVATANFVLDITDKLQDMVDRGGWANGNALMWLMSGRTVTPPINHNGWLGEKGLPLPYYEGLRAYIDVVVAP